VRKDREGVLLGSIKLGFLTGEETQTMKNAHVDAVLVIGEPFGTPGIFDFQTHNLTKRVHTLIPIMLKQRLVPPPEETYSLHRKLSGAILACAKLGAKINCQEIFDDAAHKFIAEHK